MNFRRLNVKCLTKSLSRPEEDVQQYLDINKIKIIGVNPPNPIFEFDEAPFPNSIQTVLNSKHWETPTLIQSVSIPIILGGRDMIGIAKTGSGKTAAYILPSLYHITNQHGNNGPHVLIICPTRELALQIGDEVRAFSTHFQLNMAILFGGENNRNRQINEMRNSPSIIIATPGRLLDFIHQNIIDLSMVSYLVIDEADRLLEFGFEKQLRALVRCVQPLRQTLMWSATWPKSIRDLSAEFLTDAIKVVIGSSEITVNSDVTQQFVQVDKFDKITKLTEILTDISNQFNVFKILIFVQKKTDADNLADILSKHFSCKVLVSHGDKAMMHRQQVIDRFKQESNVIVIGTDVLSRGLDVLDVTHVINFDLPRMIEDYVHRIGRTARAEKKRNLDIIFHTFR